MLTISQFSASLRCYEEKYNSKRATTRTIKSCPWGGSCIEAVINSTTYTDTKHTLITHIRHCSPYSKNDCHLFCTLYRTYQPPNTRVNKCSVKCCRTNLCNINRSTSANAKLTDNIISLLVIILVSLSIHFLQ
ncbi:uncharacterized protein LOC130649330 isoform X2 [Hydractinia symbiolongicarpus]|uniref:uncharacterized protein LOC130649330 isoform X2 n=1 Tax=Hydractinia symbiolongicarpus TaxID=13093 RepID=UPI00254C2997|nr:uncharacterized protein LOC130649330 isoform X2 [Hydractinia symbiolongicarpus]